MSEDGFANRTPYSSRVEIVEDKMPTIDIPFEKDTCLRAPVDESVNLLFSFIDDFGLDEIEIVEENVKTGRKEHRTAKTANAKDKTFSIDYIPQERGLAPGDMLLYHATASDNCPQHAGRKTISEFFSVRIIDQAESEESDSADDNAETEAQSEAKKKELDRKQLILQKLVDWQTRMTCKIEKELLRRKFEKSGQCEKPAGQNTRLEQDVKPEQGKKPGQYANPKPDTKSGQDGKINLDSKHSSTGKPRPNSKPDPKAESCPTPAPNGRPDLDAKPDKEAKPNQDDNAGKKVKQDKCGKPGRKAPGAYGPPAPEANFDPDVKSEPADLNKEIQPGRIVPGPCGTPGKAGDTDPDIEKQYKKGGKIDPNSKSGPDGKPCPNSKPDPKAESCPAPAPDAKPEKDVKPNQDDKPGKKVKSDHGDKPGQDGKPGGQSAKPEQGETGKLTKEQRNILDVLREVKDEIGAQGDDASQSYDTATTSMGDTTKDLDNENLEQALKDSREALKALLELKEQTSQCQCAECESGRKGGGKCSGGKCKGDKGKGKKGKCQGGGRSGNVGKSAPPPKSTNVDNGKAIPTAKAAADSGKDLMVKGYEAIEAKERDCPPEFRKILLDYYSAMEKAKKDGGK